MKYTLFGALFDKSYVNYSLLNVLTVHATRDMILLICKKANALKSFREVFHTLPVLPVLLYILLKRETCCFDTREQSAIRIMRATDN